MLGLWEMEVYAGAYRLILPFQVLEATKSSGKSMTSNGVESEVLFSIRVKPWDTYFKPYTFTHFTIFLN